jgi:hypothetical protein
VQPNTLQKTWLPASPNVIQTENRFVVSESQENKEEEDTQERAADTSSPEKQQVDPPGSGKEAEEERPPSHQSKKIIDQSDLAIATRTRNRIHSSCS